MPVEIEKLYAQAQAIEGWLAREAAMLFAWINDIQIKHGVAGDIFEIGVHHGKSAVVLAGLVRHGQERLTVCDVFGAQQGNPSRSGEGVRAIFEKNMAALHPKGGIRILEMPSQELRASDIGSVYRLFHIDGGHNADEAFADLELAAGVLHNRGAIVVDDPLRIEWPGVAEAICRFLLERTDLAGVLLTANKIVITSREVAEMYTSAFEDSEQQGRYGFAYPWHLKVLPFCGWPVRIFYVPTYLAGKTRAHAAS